MRQLLSLAFLALAAAIGGAASARPAQAQDLAGAPVVDASERGPRFLRAADSRMLPVDVRRTPVLARRLRLDLTGVTLGEALAVIGARAGLRLVFSEDIVPVQQRVHLKAEGITVAAALTDVLFNAGVDVVFDERGDAALVKRPPPVGQGTITGVVTDAKTGEALTGAEVALEGTRWRTMTDGDGQYHLSGVEAGSYTLAVRRIGYRRQTRPVTVAEGQELMPVTVDVALEAVPTQLDEVVTTVTGEQRLRELGHVVGRINADSLVKEAPISSLSELLSGRVPGLQVFQSQGTVGGEVHLQVRGPNSVQLGLEPIVVVDGVRYTNGVPLGGSVEHTNPLNDLNPNDIESIEVIKGPSAATLYGTDAANGVLVITTKRGREGPARWNAFARGAITEIPTQQYPDLYWGWGTVFGVPDNPDASCTLWGIVDGWCTQDSVAVLPNPLNDPDYSVLGNKPRWEYGANVAGGRQDLRYYFSGTFEDATGPVQMPPAIAERLREQRGVSELPEEWREPNALTKLNLRANVTTMFGETADLRVNTGYVRGNTRTLSLASPYAEGAFTGRPTTDPYADGRTSPAEAFAQTSTERADRFFGNASAQWRPARWLALRGTVGLDLSNRNRYTLVRRGDAPSTAPTGSVSDDRLRAVATTADFGATATARLGRLSARTAIGAQYVRNLSDGLTSSGSDLPPGGTSVGEAANVFSGQNYSETVTLGSYLEETLGWNERLFLTGALRVDGASSFGQDYDATIYPKVSASWLVSEEPFLPRVPGLDELRLRYAFGASGQQPRPDMTLPAFTPTQAVENGAAVIATWLGALGNPTLRPERVREHEFGFDATGLAGRLQLGLTWYRRRTTDQITVLSLPPGLGSIVTNLGLTTQRGFEAELTARLLDTRAVSWDVTLQHGSHTTKLVDIGDGNAVRSVEGGYVEGYPLGARFQVPLLGYADANGDGIIHWSEVQLGDTAVYMGESMPPRSQTLSTVVGLFERRLRLSALVERRSGFTQVNQLHNTQCGFGVCRAVVDPTTPLSEQGEALPFVPYPEPGDFTRLREVTAALDLPAGLTHALRLRSATLVLSARNVALWTDFSGPDPESAARGFFPLMGGVAQGIPQGRSWALRLDLGL